MAETGRISEEMKQAEVLAVKILGNIALRRQQDGWNGAFRVMKRLFCNPGKRAPRWLPSLMDDLGAVPIRNGRRISAYQLDPEIIMKQYQRVEHKRPIERKDDDTK